MVIWDGMGIVAASVSAIIGIGLAVAHVVERRRMRKKWKR